MAMNTSNLIFKETYIVRVPDITLRSEAELELHGIPITQGLSPEQNSEIALTTCMLTIAKMADIYDKGFDVFIPNHEDTLKIYDAVSKHLHAWDIHLTVSINKKTPPTEDLLLLDEFADSIFSRIKDIVSEPTDDQFARTNTSYDTVGMNAVKKKKTHNRNIERNGMSDRFKSRVSINKVDMTSI